jgi:hypothetical protein
VLGNYVSDQQWRDVQAVLRVQAGALDLQDLRHRAATRDLSALLDAALRTATARRRSAPAAVLAPSRVFSF